MSGETSDTIYIPQTSAHEEPSQTDYVCENMTVLTENTFMSSSEILASSFMKNFKTSGAKEGRASCYIHDYLKEKRKRKRFKLEDTSRNSSSLSIESFDSIDQNKRLKVDETKAAAFDGDVQDYCEQLEVDNESQSVQDTWKETARLTSLNSFSKKYSCIVAHQNRYNLRNRNYDNSSNIIPNKSVKRNESTTAKKMRIKSKNNDINFAIELKKRIFCEKGSKLKNKSIKLRSLKQNKNDEAGESHGLINPIIPFDPSSLKTLEKDLETEEGKCKLGKELALAKKRGRKRQVKLISNSLIPPTDLEDPTEQVCGADLLHPEKNSNTIDVEHSKIDATTSNSNILSNEPTTSCAETSSKAKLGNIHVDEISSHSIVFRDTSSHIWKNDVQYSRTNKKKRKVFLADEDVQFDIRGKPYQVPSLVEPAGWVSRQLYKFLIKKLEPVFGLEAKIKSEEVVIVLCTVVKDVETLTEGKTFSLLPLKKILFEYNICRNLLAFYTFLNRFSPFSFQSRVLPLNGHFSIYELGTTKTLFDPLLPEE